MISFQHYNLSGTKLVRCEMVNPCFNESHKKLYYMIQEQFLLKDTFVSTIIHFYLHHERAQDGPKKEFRMQNHALNWKAKMAS